MKNFARILLLGFVLASCSVQEPIAPGSASAGGTEEKLIQTLTPAPRLKPSGNAYAITWVKPGTYVTISAYNNYCDFVLYTTDGSTPGSSPTTLAGPSHIPTIYVPVGQGLRLKARTVNAGVYSAVAEATYYLAVYQ